MQNTVTRRDFIRASTLSIMGLGGLSQCAKKQKKTNILFILVDDLGWADVSCYGDRQWKTPALDKLATEGMKFTDAYAAAPVCSPTRASIMTGKYPARTGVTDWIPGWSDRYVNPRVITSENAQHLQLEEYTLAEALRSNGYKTACVGKWHLGEATRYYADKQGFDFNYMISHGNTGHYYVTEKNEQGVDFHTRQPDECKFLTRHLREKAETWLEQNRDKPFFLYFSTHVVHTPIKAKDEIVQKYLSKGLPEDGVNNATYAAMVEHMDRNIGLLLQKLDKLGLRDSTVVLFISDNGGRGKNISTNDPLRGAKGQLWEGGIREPMIVRWSGVVEPGSENNQPVTTTDFYPTLLEIADAPLTPEQHQDGVSLVPLFKQSDTPGRDAIYWHYPHYNSTGVPGGAIRQGNFKLIEFYNDGHLELYDLSKDLSETTDLSDKMPDKAKELHAKLIKWRKEVGAKMPVSNPDYDPAKTSYWPN